MPPQEINNITEKIIGCAYTVSNTLGIGFVKRFMKMRWLLLFVKRA